MKAHGAIYFILICTSLTVSLLAHDRHPSPGRSAGGPKPVSANRTNVVLPPRPDDVADVKFSDFFKPIGPRGLEFTDKLKSLDGKRVRIHGYMVRQSEPLPGQFLLAPIPVQLHETEYGFAEDLPASTLFVVVPEKKAEVIPHTHQELLLTGMLSVGNRAEANGRISSIRLTITSTMPGGAGRAAARGGDEITLGSSPSTR